MAQASHLTPIKKAAMVTALLDKSSYQVGLEFGLDKYYKNSKSMISMMSKIYNQVKNNPDKFGMSTDLLSEIDKKVKLRLYQIDGVVQQRKSLREQADERTNRKIEDIALDNRAKAGALLNLKLDDILYSKKNRQKVNLTDLAKVYGITFDKGQIVEGKATDHVSVMSKVKIEEMGVNDAIDAILKMREYNQSISESMKDKK